jgi:HK97 family phage prohead protease
MQTHVHKLHIKSYGDDGKFSGYASVFNYKDHQGDVVLKGAFEKSLQTCRHENQWPKMLWQHDSASPIGFWTDIYEDHYGLFVKGQLLLDVQKGREAYSLLKKGVIDGLSIGFRLEKASRGTQGRLIHQVDLQEISLVTFAANEQAKVREVKHAPWLQQIEGWLERLQELQGLLTNVSA